MKKAVIDHLVGLRIALNIDSDTIEQAIANLQAILHVYVNEQVSIGALDPRLLVSLYDEAYAKYRAEFAKVVKSDYDAG